MNYLLTEEEMAVYAKGKQAISKVNQLEDFAKRYVHKNGCVKKMCGYCDECLLWELPENYKNKCMAGFDIEVSK